MKWFAYLSAANHKSPPNRANWDFSLLLALMRCQGCWRGAEHSLWGPPELIVETWSPGPILIITIQEQHQHGDNRYTCICYPRAGVSWRGGCLAQRWCSGALRFASPLVTVHHHMLCAGTRGWIVRNTTALSDCLTLSYISRQIKVKRTAQTA